MGIALRAYMREPDSPTRENWPAPIDQDRASATRSTLRRVLETILARIAA